MFFSDHCSIVQAWRLKVTCFAQKCDFGPPICAPRGLQNATTGAQFSPKRPQMRGPPNYLGRLGGDLGDQRSKNSPSLRFHRFKGRFWGDFRLDFRHIWVRFRSNLSYHLWSLISIPKALLIEVFPTASSWSMLIFGVPYKLIIAYLYPRKGELSREASWYSTVSWFSICPTYPISPTCQMYAI